jgi:hypothetical protein
MKYFGRNHRKQADDDLFLASFAISVITGKPGTLSCFLLAAGCIMEKITPVSAPSGGRKP